MMMMSSNRIRSSAMVLALIVLALLPARSVSASQLQIIAPTPTLLATQSETVSVMFTSTENFTLTAADIEIAFDSTRFSISNVQLGSLDTGSGFQLDDGGNDGTLSPLQSSISTSSPTGISITVGQTGTLETFTLTALANAPIGGAVGDLNLLGNAGRTNTAVYNEANSPPGTPIVLTPAPMNGLDANDATVTVTTVPEPSSLILMGVGCLITVTTMLRKKARKTVA